MFINWGSAPNPEIYRIGPNGSSLRAEALGQVEIKERLLTEEQLVALDPLGIDRGARVASQQSSILRTMLWPAS